MCPDLKNQVSVRRVLALAAYPAHRWNLWLFRWFSQGSETTSGTGALLVGDRGHVRATLPGGEQWYNLRPDALAEYRVESQQMRFWLEWDRGTMNVRDLAIKFSSYAHFIASREWAREDARVPKHLCVAPDIAQERYVSSPGLMLWTTTEVLLNEYGPLAPIWLLGTPKSGQVGLSGKSLRQSLSEMMSVSKFM
jgi:hypothetical protein